MPLTMRAVWVGLRNVMVFFGKKAPA